MQKNNTGLQVYTGAIQRKYLKWCIERVELLCERSFFLFTIVFNK